MAQLIDKQRNVNIASIGPGVDKTFSCVTQPCRCPRASLFSSRRFAEQNHSRPPRGLTKRVAAENSFHYRRTSNIYIRR